ncbi:MAG: ferric iron uptake transcriptional regulator [Burkholderiales bacterium]|jgi:Fur family ferric uptake transcriptional regulator|nr:ferric iron uptake transcriptional regulator [Burkholderiales bacterium]
MTTTPQDLKDRGFKATLPRLHIIRLFETSRDSHMTAEDVYRRLKDDGLDIGLATIYRVLTQFEQAGLLLRHHFESDKAVYEINRGHHHDHIVCLHCGKVEEFFDAGIEKRQNEIARKKNFEVVDHSLCLYGYCATGACAERRRAEESGGKGQEPES